MATFSVLIMYLVAFLAMFISADYAKRTAAASFAAKISSNWQRNLVTAFTWGLTASVVGSLMFMLFGMAAPFLSWLVMFTAIDFIFGMLRSPR